ncbi:hypothetical protein BJ508DRAFT_311185 [Ascobolus immersus RN42]|uniref:Uncharacterized protein n=1 Tax=Ascobolus immersus RN42 TaxID=1160509 RepID=A0A3N4HWZ8_ASCIM|nr:hypothetical protein BJ508DRAFT_311185 [Ascobolus immersus RN42]
MESPSTSRKHQIIRKQQSFGSSSRLESSSKSSWKQQQVVLEAAASHKQQPFSEAAVAVSSREQHRLENSIPPEAASPLKQQSSRKQQHLGTISRFGSSSRIIAAEAALPQKHQSAAPVGSASRKSQSEEPVVSRKHQRLGSTFRKYQLEIAASQILNKYLAVKHPRLVGSTTVSEALAPYCLPSSRKDIGSTSRNCGCGRGRLAIGGSAGHRWVGWPSVGRLAIGGPSRVLLKTTDGLSVAFFLA